MVTYLLEREEEFPGTIILTQPVRNYPYRQVGAHILGHLGEVSQEELSANSAFGVESGDLVGKMGIEKVYNSYLQGEKGGEQVEVDAYGRFLKVISELSFQNAVDATNFLLFSQLYTIFRLFKSSRTTMLSRGISFSFKFLSCKLKFFYNLIYSRQE